MKSFVSLLLALCFLGSSIAYATDDKYEEAIKLFESGKYAEAQALFEDLEKYYADLVKECKYQQALEYMGDREIYRKEILYAIPLLEDLGEYKDSPDLLKEAYYKTGWNLSLSTVSVSVCQSIINMLLKSGDYGEDTDDIIRGLRAKSLWCYIQETGTEIELEEYDAEAKYITFLLQRNEEDDGGKYLNIYALESLVLVFDFINKSDNADQKPMDSDWNKSQLRIIVYPYSEEADVFCYSRLQFYFESTNQIASTQAQGTGTVNINTARKGTDIHIDQSISEIVSIDGTYTKQENENNTFVYLLPVNMYRDFIVSLDEVLATLPIEVTIYDLGFYKGWANTAERLKEINNRLTIGMGGFFTLAIRNDHEVIAVGNNAYGNCNVDDWEDIIAIDAAYEDGFSVGLKSDGTVIATGTNEYGQCDTSEWTDVIAINASNNRTIGLKKDGTVVATGFNEDGQCNLSDWKNIVAVSAGAWHTIGLRSNGSVVSAGNNKYKQCEVSDWDDIVKVVAEHFNTAGLTAEGTVVVAGNNDYGQCETSDWKDIIDIDIGVFSVVGLKSDGTVIAAGSNDYSQCNVSEWKNIVAISAGKFHTVGLCSDGTVIATGYNKDGRCNVSKWSDVIRIYAGDYQTVGIHSDGTISVVGEDSWSQCDVSEWTDIMIPESYTLLDIIG